jgi:hypothetical protein
VHGNKPSGWSRRSNATYYREAYALQMKATIDAMWEDRQDRFYSYETWKHMSHNSVYLRINQSIRYLVDNLDPEHKYARFMQMVSITRERNKGVKITFNEEYRFADTSSFSPAPVIPQSETPKWKQKIETWLEESEPGDKPFILEGLMLSAEEVRELKLQFAGLKNVGASISASTIRLIKMNTPV